MKKFFSCAKKKHKMVSFIQLRLIMKRILIIILASLTSACNQPQPPHGLPKNWNVSAQKVFVFDPVHYEWAAYNEHGKKIKTGPASGGKDYCPDTKKACRTVVGTFQVTNKKGVDCTSNQFPIAKNSQESGGAKMPYCMYFHEGYAIHGARHVSKHHTSHGCIHVSTQDAKWLNEQFVAVGTAVVVLPYS